MNVLMTSTSYPSTATDWRGVFIRHLVEALADRVNLHLWAPPGDRPDNVMYACLPEEAARLHTLMEQGGIAHLLRTGGLARVTAPMKLLALLRKAYQRHSHVDLFHINWLQNALPLLGTKQPALISVLGSDLKLLNLPGMTLLLRQIIRRRRCIIAPNAGWMVPTLTQRFGDIAKVIPIVFGIDADWYQLTRDWQPSHPQRWLVVSRLTKNKIGPLFDWGKDLFQANHELHLFGPRQEALDIPDWVHYHGPTHPQELKTHWFPQAAGLISLSQHDEGRPQVMLEAMAAGLPILASSLPAHRDFLTHQNTGWLTESPENFQRGLEWLTTPRHNESVSRQARQWALQNIGTWADCAQRYLTAYHLLTKENTP